MSSNPLWTATYRVGEADLEDMTLVAGDLPDDLRGYQLARSGPLGNRELAENGFSGSSADRFRNAGRIGGFMREFVPTADISPASGVNFVGATVVHLFENPDQVSGWMSDIFLRDFEDNVGRASGITSRSYRCGGWRPAGFTMRPSGCMCCKGGRRGCCRQR